MIKIMRLQSTLWASVLQCFTICTLSFKSWTNQSRNIVIFPRYCWVLAEPALYLTLHATLGPNQFPIFPPQIAEPLTNPAFTSPASNVCHDLGIDRNIFCKQPFKFSGKNWEFFVIFYNSKLSTKKSPAALHRSNKSLVAPRLRLTKRAHTFRTHFSLATARLLIREN